MRRLLQRAAGLAVCLLATSCAYNSGPGSATVTIHREVGIDSEIGDVGVKDAEAKAPKREP